MPTIFVHLGKSEKNQSLLEFATWMAISSQAKLHIISEQKKEESQELTIPCGVPPELNCTILSQSIRDIQNAIASLLSEGTRIGSCEDDSETYDLPPLELLLESKAFKLSEEKQLVKTLEVKAEDFFIITASKQSSEIDKSLEILHHLPCGFLAFEDKGDYRPLKKVSVLISEGKDAPRILPWLAKGPSITRVELEVLTARNGDEEAEILGKQLLSRRMKFAGIGKSVEFITQKVLVTTNATKAIAEHLEQSNSSLVISGCSRHSSLSHMIYGKFNEKLSKNLSQVSFASIRASKSLYQRFVEEFERLCNISVPQLNREERSNVYSSMDINSRIGFDFVLQMSLSASIASLGLMTNSAAVVIGAMLVAPLMTPILACGLAIIQHNIALCKRSITSLSFGFITAIIIGYLFGLMSIDKISTTEMLSRGKPGVPDMIVAVLSGLAAAYSQGRQSMSAALAGVAIAAALVPPLACIGLSLSFGEFTDAWGAFILFVTNVLAIILGGAIAFFAVGIRSTKKSRWAANATAGTILGLGVLMIPLNFDRIIQVFKKSYPNTTSINTIVQKDFKEIKNLKIVQSRVQEKADDIVELELTIETHEVLSPTESLRLKALIQKTFADGEEWNKKLKIRIRTILVQNI